MTKYNVAQWARGRWDRGSQSATKKPPPTRVSTSLGNGPLAKQLTEASSDLVVRYCNRVLEQVKQGAHRGPQGSRRSGGRHT